MAFDYTLFLGPLMGGIIGYVTNDIAIRMMFRPHEAKHIMGIKIPFTPGIIPKEKGRIAEAIGNAISTNLMNREVLEKNLLSPEMLDKITKTCDEIIAVQKANEHTLRETLKGFLSEEEIDAIQADTCRQLASQLHQRLEHSNLGQKISHAVMVHVIDKMSTGLTGFIGVDKALDLVADKAERLLTKHVNEIIAHNSHEIVSGLIDHETTRLLDTKVCNLLEGHDEQLEQAKQIALKSYKTVISEHLPHILSTIDISSIVRARINEMDMQEAEDVILSVMKKELRAIVWLGALLGTIIGTVNAIV